MNKIIKIFSFIQVYFKSPLSLNYLTSNTFSIASSQILHNIQTYNIQLASIIDVGANKGQFAKTAKQFYPTAIVHSFEPEPNTFQKLKRNIKSSDNITIYNTALGSYEGEIDFYRNAHSHASSILHVSDYQKKNVPATAFETKIKVPIKKLEQAIDIETLPKPVLLKLDVQGYEMEVIKGAQKILPQIEYLLLEVSFVEMYTGEPLFKEIDSFLETMGYELIAPVGLLQGKSLQILQMDMLYKRIK